MKLKLTAVAAIAAFIFSSCEHDMSVETGSLPGGVLNGTAPAASNFSTCKDCSYYPTCSGSVYHYRDTSYGATTGTAVDYTLTYVKDTVMEGRNYQKITGAGQQNTYFNCSSGVSSSIILGGVTAGGTTVPYVKVTALKANEPVGASWADNITSSGQTALFTYTIVSKGGTKMVAGNNYADVIHVHEQTTVDIPGVGAIPAGQSEYYFAKGKGLIESISIDDFTGLQILHHILLSANIP